MAFGAILGLDCPFELCRNWALFCVSVLFYALECLLIQRYFARG